MHLKHEESTRIEDIASKKLNAFDGNTQIRFMMNQYYICHQSELQ
jgi:hypothetical protein